MRNRHSGSAALALMLLLGGPALAVPAGAGPAGGGQLRAQAAEATPAESVRRPSMATLRAEVEALATLAGGTMGVAAVHLESGRELYLNGDERFPMASTYKVPIAVQLLHRVGRGEVRLDSMVEVRPGDLHPGSGTLTRLFDDPGVILSLRNLLELMLLISDNSGTDLVLEAAGGPTAVTRRMRSLGIEGLRVDRPTVTLIADWLGLEGLSPEEELTPERFDSLYEEIPEERREQAEEAFDADPRDTATPRAMARLLRQIWDREALPDEHAELLLDIMRRSETGRNRIQGLLPPDVEVAHKTGTIGGTTNDVGIISLPHDRGHLLVVAFVKGSERDVEERERAIAQVSRSLYDYFLFTADGASTDGG